MSMFSQPTAPAMGGFFKPAEHDGHLILITNVHAIEDRYDNFKGREVPAATCDLVDLTDEGSELREGVLITHTGIVNRLHAGAHMVLGRIGKAPTKSGFEAWVLNEFDETAGDAQRAEAWLNAQAKPTVSQPAPQAAPAPAPAPVQQQAPAAPTPAPAPAAPAMADPNDPAVQALLANLQQK